jgi:hypothetical protein
MKFVFSISIFLTKRNVQERFLAVFEILFFNLFLKV